MTEQPDKTPPKSLRAKQSKALIGIVVLLLLLAVMTLLKRGERAPNDLVVMAESEARGSATQSLAGDKANAPGPEVATVQRKVIGRMACRDNVDHYDRETDGYYYLTETRSVCKNELYLNDIPLSDQQEQVSTDLPDRERGEYRRLQLLHKADGAVLLVEEHSAADGLGGLLTFRSETPVMFLQGDWASFQAGEDVILKYTEDGLAKLKGSLEKRLQQEIESLFREALISDDEPLAAAVSFESSVEFKELHNSTMIINQAAIDYSDDGPSDFVFQVSRKAPN